MKAVLIIQLNEYYKTEFNKFFGSFIADYFDKFSNEGCISIKYLF